MNISFFANQEVSAEDLNAVVTNFGCEGPGFTNETSYTVEDLNRITAAITTAGVSIDGFNPSIVGSVLTITNGMAYFSDGYKFYLDSDTSMNVDITDGYVYITKDEEQIVHLLITEEGPPDGAIILAALVGGQVDDRRTYALAKASGIGGRVYQKILPIYYDITTDQSWKLRAEITPAFPPRYIIIDDVIVKLSDTGEIVEHPNSSHHGYEGYSIENGILKIWHKNGLLGAPTLRSGYIELR